jgi:hypothetical protein
MEAPSAARTAGSLAKGFGNMGAEMGEYGLMPYGSKPSREEFVFSHWR